MSDLNKPLKSNVKLYILGAKQEIGNSYRLNYKLTEAINNKKDIWNLPSLIYLSVSKVIIFCALALEAYINEYLIRKTSRKYYREHIKGLSLKSKYVFASKVVDPQLYLDTSTNVYENFQWLIKTRNALVHYDSINDIDNDLTEEDCFAKYHKGYIDNVRDLGLDHATKAYLTILGVFKIFDQDIHDYTNTIK